jgi:hypothetical protein
MCHEWERRAYKVLIGKPEEKKPLRRPKLNCELNTKMDLNEIGCQNVN